MDSSETEEEQLRAVLMRFYTERNCADKLENLGRIAQRYRGDNVVDLWATMAGKYSLPPHCAVSWLACSLGERMAVQWPQDEVPEAAQGVLDHMAKASSLSVGSLADASLEDTLEAALEGALGVSGVAAVAALVFRWGCPTPALRLRAWRTLLFAWPRARSAPRAATAARGSSAGPWQDHDAGLRERRLAYHMLRERMVAAESASLAQLREEIEAEASAVWRGQELDFFQRKEVQSSIVAVALAHAWQFSTRSPGACQIAAMMLFVASSAGVEIESLADEGEADAFWCLAQVSAELRAGACEEDHRQVGRAHSLLRAYDSQLAAVLSAQGLGAFAASRLITALFTRSGFSLAGCIRLWDALLADPRRFDFCNCLSVALLLSHRDELLHHRADSSYLAETLLELPQRADTVGLLRQARAVCAFERRSTASGSQPLYPPRDGDGVGVDVALEKAGQPFQTFWGLARVVGAETVAFGQTVATDWGSHLKEQLHVAEIIAQVAGDIVADVTADIRGDDCATSEANSLVGRSTFCISPGVARTPDYVSLRPGEVAQTMLTQALAQSLVDFLPVQLRLPGAVEWILKYTPKAHGVSLSTLYRQVAASEKTVLMVRDAEEHVFGGFVPVPWAPKGKFYGSGESFVFKFGCPGEAPVPDVYTWTSRNAFFQYADNTLLAMGGGDGHHALALCNDLLRGHSSPTVTFGNPTLSKSQEFVVRDLEVWALQEIS